MAMQRHVLRRGLKQLGDLRLGQPQRFALKATLNTRAAIFSLIEDDVGLRQGHGLQRFVLLQPPAPLIGQAVTLGRAAG